MKPLSVLLVWSLLWPSLATPAFAQAQSADGLTIIVLQGEGATNRTGGQTVQTPLRVRIKNEGQPVQGTGVVFAVPSKGAGGRFGKKETLTVTTDASGEARTTAFLPNEMPGPFQIQVRADHAGQTAMATINQTNELSPAVHRKRERGKIIAIAVLAIGVGSLVGTLRSLREVNRAGR